MDTPGTLSSSNAFHAFGTDDGIGGMTHSRRAKIVATLGPSCSTPDIFRKLVRAGVDVARLNFSHGSHAQKGELIRMVRDVAAAEHKPCLLYTSEAQRKRHPPRPEPSAKDASNLNARQVSKR